MNIWFVAACEAEKDLGSDRCDHTRNNSRLPAFVEKTVRGEPEI
jgi:hypothetical protein